MALEKDQEEPKSPDSCLNLNYENYAVVHRIISNICDLGQQIVLSSFENRVDSKDYAANSVVEN